MHQAILSPQLTCRFPLQGTGGGQGAVREADILPVAGWVSGSPAPDVTNWFWVFEVQDIQVTGLTLSGGAGLDSQASSLWGHKPACELPATEPLVRSSDAKQGRGMVGLAVILKPLKKGRGSWQVFYMPEHERTWRLKSHPRFHFLEPNVTGEVIWVMSHQH